MRRAVVAAAILLTACATAVAGVTGDWSGAYSYSFQNGATGEANYRSTNHLSIVRIDDASALVEMDLQFFNGHSCEFSEVLRVEGESLVYREPETPNDHGQCVMTITRENGALMLDDRSGGCAQETCSGRGAYSDISFPAASRRRLPDAQRPAISSNIGNVSRN
ncbi:MAG: hypothetical protein ABL871_02225 [Terricaulis sp.]